MSEKKDDVDGLFFGLGFVVGGKIQIGEEKHTTKTVMPSLNLDFPVMPKSAGEVQPHHAARVQLYWPADSYSQGAQQDVIIDPKTDTLQVIEYDPSHGPDKKGEVIATYSAMISEDADKIYAGLMTVLNDGKIDKEEQQQIVNLSRELIHTAKQGHGRE